MKDEIHYVFIPCTMQVGFLSTVHALKRAAHKIEYTTQHDQSQPAEMPRDNLKQLSVK